jgi:hypothetical protein
MTAAALIAMTTVDSRGSRRVSTHQFDWRFSWAVPHGASVVTIASCPALYDAEGVENRNLKRQIAGME